MPLLFHKKPKGIVTVVLSDKLESIYTNLLARAELLFLRRVTNEKVLLTETYSLARSCNEETIFYYNLRMLGLLLFLLCGVQMRGMLLTRVIICLTFHVRNSIEAVRRTFKH